MIEAPTTASTHPIVRVTRLALVLTFAVGLAVAVIGGIIGWFVGGWDGVFSAAIGAALAVVFGAITAISVRVGASFGGFSFLGVVLGAWIVKIIVFIALLATVARAEFVVKEVLFGAIVVAILGSLAADSIAATRSRVPYVDDER